MSPQPMLSSFALLSVQTLSSVLQVLHRWVLKERYRWCHQSMSHAGVHCKSCTRQCHSPVSRQVVMLTHADTTLRRGWTFIHRMPFSRWHYYTARWMVGCFILTVNMHIRSSSWLACTNTAYQNRLTSTVRIMRFIAAYTPPHCVSCA